MTTLAATSLLFGAALGLRFSVFILIPATALLLVGIGAFAFALGSGEWPSAMMVATFALDAGFLITSVARPLLAPEPLATQPAKRRNDPQRA